MKNLLEILFTGSFAGGVVFSVAPSFGISAMLSLGMVARNLTGYARNRLPRFFLPSETFIAVIEGLHTIAPLVFFALAALDRPPAENPQLTAPDERPR